MTRRYGLTVAGMAALLTAATFAGRGWAQEAPAETEGVKAEKPPSEGKTAKAAAARPEAAKADRHGVPDRCAATATLSVQVVITRFQNEKKQASLPYTLLVSSRPTLSCPPSRVRMRMGVDTPVPIAPSGPATSYQYKNVGTNIDCTAWDLGGGRYQINLSVENSSALPGSEGIAANESLVRLPLFRRFETTLDPVLRDGQTIQTVASTDPVTGEVVKIDVTLNVVK